MNPTANPADQFTAAEVTLDFDAALKEAREGKPSTAAVPPQREWKPGHPANRSILWQNSMFGQIKVEVRDFALENFSQSPTVASAHVLINKKKKFPAISFTFDTLLQGGVTLLHAKGGNVTDVTNSRVPVLTVPIRWKDMPGGENIPQTREKDVDNVDLFIFRDNGMFVQIQVAVSVHHEEMWLSIQEVSAGQVARTNLVKARSALHKYAHEVGGHAGVIVPLYPYCAYPYHNYLRVNPRMGPQVIEKALRSDATRPLGETVEATWQPDFDKPLGELENYGFEVGVVEWSNALLGWGFARAKDGTPVRIHISQLYDREGRKVADSGKFPYLEPMSSIAMKVEEGIKGNAGKYHAVEIRLLD